MPLYPDYTLFPILYGAESCGGGRCMRTDFEKGQDRVWSRVYARASLRIL